MFSSGRKTMPRVKPKEEVDQGTLDAFQAFFPKIQALMIGDDLPTHREVGRIIRMALKKGIDPYIDWCLGEDQSDGPDPFCPTTGEWVEDITDPRQCPPMLNGE